MSSTKAKQFFRDLNVDRAKSGTKLTAKCDRQSRRVCRIAKCGLRVVPIARNSCTTANFRTFLLTVFLVRRKIRPVVLGKIMHGRVWIAEALMLFRKLNVDHDRFHSIFHTRHFFFSSTKLLRTQWLKLRLAVIRNSKPLLTFWDFHRNSASKRRASVFSMIFWGIFSPTQEELVFPRDFSSARRFCENCVGRPN